MRKIAHHIKYTSTEELPPQSHRFNPLWIIAIVLIAILIALAVLISQNGAIKENTKPESQRIAESVQKDRERMRNNQRDKGEADTKAAMEVAKKVVWRADIDWRRSTGNKYPKSKIIFSIRAKDTIGLLTPDDLSSYRAINSPKRIVIVDYKEGISKEKSIIILVKKKKDGQWKTLWWTSPVDQ